MLGMDLNSLKEEMNDIKKLKVKTSSAIEKQFGRGYRFEEEHKRNELYRTIYSHSKTLPVKVGHVVINYKLYQSFLKKLKGYEIELLIKGDYLELHYCKPFSKSKGTLILDDISQYFKGFKHIPIAELRNASKA